MFVWVCVYLGPVNENTWTITKYLTAYWILWQPGWDRNLIFFLFILARQKDIAYGTLSGGSTMTFFRSAIYLYLSIYSHMSVYLSIYISIYVFIFLYVYIAIYIYYSICLGSPRSRPTRRCGATWRTRCRACSSRTTMRELNESRRLGLIKRML